MDKIYNEHKKKTKSSKNYIDIAAAQMFATLDDGIGLAVLFFISLFRILSLLFTRF